MGDADTTGATARGSCCGGGPHACVFAKAVVSRSVDCELARRGTMGESELVTCASPVARTHCGTLAALLRERATFALKLPRPGTPLVHAKALQLQCGGLLALQRVLGADAANEAGDVHRMVALAQRRWGSLLDAPWGDIVPALAAWQPRRRHRPQPR